jgi:hypothetical protein
MNGVLGQVEDIDREGGGVILDRGGHVHWLEGVRKPEELCGFREVLDLDGMGRRRTALCGGELCCEAVCEEIMCEGGSSWAKEIYEEGGADFAATA